MIIAALALHLHVSRMDEQTVREAAAAQYGSAPQALHMTGTAPITPALDRSWDVAVACARRVPDDEEMFAIDQHAGEPLTDADIAAAARLSPRGLQSAFQRDLDTSPLAYLRRIGLDGARHALLAADPTAGATVADTARRWGFAHLGRSSTAYRDMFGEYPRDAPGRWLPVTTARRSTTFPAHPGTFTLVDIVGAFRRRSAALPCGLDRTLLVLSIPSCQRRMD